jgi:L-Ala-D/L-Glu epimerase
MKLDYERVRAPLRSPFAASHGTVSERELLLVCLETEAGLTGYGEAAPLPSYDGISIADVEQALEACRSLLQSADSDQHAALLAQCAEVTTVPQALAAIDLALWDLRGREIEQPVWALLNGVSPEPLAVNWTISAADRAGAASEAARARDAGFSTVKAKVAIGDDHGRLAAIRAAAGPQMAIRVDANGAWSLEEAQASLRMLEPVGIELCEEPVSGLEATSTLSRQTSIPLALDEGTALPGALDHRVCQLACLKVSGCGGISELIRAAGRARAAGYEVFLASTLDGPLGIAAALHAASALGPMRPCGLATMAMFSDRSNPLPAKAGAIELPAGPGLGDGLLEWYRS